MATAALPDYRNSHGNTWEVVPAAHQIRDGAFEDTSSLRVQDTRESYDLVIVESGGAGLTAAYFFYKAKEKAGQKCLILENHPIFGGEAKQNGVSGQRPTAHPPARCLAHGLRPRFAQ
jgi:spermidine dehydrogenase